MSAFAEWHPPLRLTGHVFERSIELFDINQTTRKVPDLLESRDVLPLKRLDNEVEGYRVVTFDVGDVALDPRLDTHEPAPSVYSGPGYYSGLVFDGRCWREFKAEGLLPNDGHRFATQLEKYQAQESLELAILAHEGALVTWHDRAYELTGLG